MPDVGSSRVKNTGYGEIDYSTAPGSNSATSASAADSATGSTGGVTVNSVNGLNIGTGYGLFAGTNGNSDIVLEFKTIRAGTGITISEDGQTITLNSTNSGGGGGGSGPADGYHLILGNAAVDGDGSFLPGAVTLDANTSVTEAVDMINEVLGMLVPSAPPAFPGGSLTIINTVGTNPLLAASVLDHANSSLVAGAPVTRVIGNVNSNSFNDIGPGNSGDVQLFMNGGIASDVGLTGTGDTGTFNGLVIADQKDFPANQPGFFKSIDISASGATTLVGINKMKIKHTAAGETNEIFFVNDDLTSTPVISTGSVAQSSAGTLAYSSSVPHYGTGGVLSVGASFTNLAGQTYYGGSDPFTVSGTVGIITSQAFTYTNIGVTTPIAHNTVGATAILPLTVNIDGTTHGFGAIQGVAKNVNGASAPTSLSSTAILVKRGAAASNKVDELSVPVSGLGSAPNTDNAIRVGIAAAGDQPVGSPATWVQTASLQSYDAAVVAGVLSNNQTNYSMGFLPVGPNLSVGRNNPQYVNFSFNRAAVSQFKITVTGTYAGAWIKLPGVSDNSTISPNATNGWWDATKSYAGAGVPGNASDPTAGCAVGAVMGGTSGSYTITFGPQTSTNSNGNQIIVRIRLNAGQSITALSFSN